MSKVKGSSPLVRGAPVAAILMVGMAGIIPARAGSTQPLVLEITTNGDHPRSCGEHSAIGLALSTILGSSPLVRGARHNKASSVTFIGIIPARAGSTTCGR